MITIKPFKALAIAAALSTAAGAGVAQQSNQPGAKQQPAVAHGQAATEDFKASMDKMHQAMMANNDADPDRAWALKMIEHHRGAISMSEVVIKHGDDADAKRMAQKTVDEQKKDIAELEAWLDRHGGRKSQP